MATTYNNLYLDTRARLRKAGVDNAQLEAREIVCYAADKSRSSCTGTCPCMSPPSWRNGWTTW